MVGVAGRGGVLRGVGVSLKFGSVGVSVEEF